MLENNMLQNFGHEVKKCTKKLSNTNTFIDILHSLHDIIEYFSTSVTPVSVSFVLVSKCQVPGSDPSPARRTDNIHHRQTACQPASVAAALRFQPVAFGSVPASLRWLRSSLLSSNTYGGLGWGGTGTLEVGGAWPL